MNFGKIFHGLVVAILSYLLVICLLLGANATVFSSITSDRQEIKSILSESGAYRAAGPAIFDSLAKEQTPEDAAVISLKNPAVKKVAANVFDESFMQKTFEGMLDGTYGWLEGKSAEPSFNIELKSATKSFALGLSDYTAKRLKKLPPCSFDQLQEDYDIFTVKCAPPGVTKKVIKSKINQAIADQPNLLSDQTIKASEIKDSEGSPIFKKLENLPRAFQTAKTLPWMLGLIGLAAASGVYFMSETKNKALKRLGITFLAGSVLLLITPWAINFYIDNVFTKVVPQEPVLREILLPAAREFNQHAATIYYVFGASAVVAGTAALIVRRSLGQKS